MKSFLTVTFIIFLFSISEVYSQSPVYQASDYADAGDNFVYTSVFRPTLNFYSGTIQKSGANQVWDFRFLVGMPQYDKEFYNPQSFYNYGASYLGLCGLSCYDDCFNSCTFPFGCNYYCGGTCALTCGTQWAGFNLAEKLLDDIDLNPTVNFSLNDQFLILSKNSNSLKAGAIAATVNGMIPVVVPFSGQDKLLQFPMQLGTAHQSASSFSIDLTPVNVNLSYDQQQTRNVEVTGYGTIQTPYQSYNNALQVRTRLSLDMTVNANGTILTSAQFPSSLKPDDVIEYAWYVPGIGAPVFRAIGFEKSGATYFARVDYLDVANRWWWPYPMFSYMPNINFLKLDDGPVGVQFNNESRNASSYHWDFGDGSFSDEENPLHVYEQGGWYVVALTASEGYASESYSQRIFLATTTSFTGIFEGADEHASLNKPETSEIKAYPNPFDETLVIHFASPGEGMMTLELFDAYGKKIHAQSKFVTNGQEILEDMNLADTPLSSGIYFLRVTLNDWRKTLPLTKL